MMWSSTRAAAAAVLVWGVVGGSSAAPAQSPKQGGAAGVRTAVLPIRTDGPKSLDPARGSTNYDNQACSQIYDGLLQYKYLSRPLDLEPAMAARMPEVVMNADGTQTWKFVLRDDLVFQDDPCFEGGKGRKIVAGDLFFSWKRLADPQYELKNWWLVAGMIKGFDAYKDAQGAAVKAKDAAGLEAGKKELREQLGKDVEDPAERARAEAELEEAFKHITPGKFDYDAPVSGLRVISDRELEVVLAKPVQQFRWKLAMFQMSAVPREAVEKYGEQFGAHPVGSGPYSVKDGDWKPGQYINFTKNPTYRDERYPSELPADPVLAARDKARELDKPAGKRLPFLDRIESPFYVPDPPMWLDFESGKLGFVQMPSEYFDKAVNRRTLKLKSEYAKRGVQMHAEPLLDFIFRGFNMEDPVVGGYDERGRKVRLAISLALDLDEFNDSFYNGVAIVYDGPIPPGLDGYPKGGRVPHSPRGPNIARARQLLAEAGYPDGKGLPPIICYTSRGGFSEELAQAEVNMCKAIGVNISQRLVDFSELIEAINKKASPMFSFSWGSDYPDAESNLGMFYGPNKSPGSNSFNYDRPEYNQMYERSRTLPPGEERTKLYERMRDMLIEDVPFVGSMARTRFYLINPWLKNFKPSEDFQNWYKYLDVSSEQ